MYLKAETAISSCRTFTVLSILASAVLPPTADSVSLTFSEVWAIVDTARWGCQADCTVAVQQAIQLEKIS